MTQIDRTQRPYHVGTTADSPKHNIEVGGVSFPQQTATAVGQGAETKYSYRAGAVVMLDEEQVARVRAAIDERVVRPNSDGGGTILLTTQQQGRRPYRKQPVDVPLAAFVYMVGPLEDAQAGIVGRDGIYPPSIAASITALGATT